MSTTALNTPTPPTNADTNASSFELLRLAAAGGRSDRLRIGLTALGSAAATVALAAAAAVAFISDGDGPYGPDVLDQPGLRPGVIAALLALCLPILMFVGICSRVGAPARDRRLAAIRMAGATPSQATRVAVYETGVAALAGAVVGVVAFQLGRVFFDSTSMGEFTVQIDEGSTRAADGLVRSLPTDVSIPVWALAGIVALIVFGSAASAAFAMRSVRLSPFGVTRTAPATAPTRTAAALFLAGVGILSLLGVIVPIVDELTIAVAGVSMLGFVLCVAGLVTGSASLSMAVGCVLAPRVSRPDLLIASRRMIAAPYTASRATSSVVLAVLIGAAVQGTRANFLTSQDPFDTFYADTFRLVDLVLIAAIVIAAMNLLVVSAEAVVERRRTLATLVANGTPRPVLARAILLETLVPLVPAVLLAGVAGMLGARAFWGTSVERVETFELNGSNDLVSIGVPIPWERLAVLTGGTIVMCLAVTAVSLLFLERSTRPAEFRAAA